MWWLRNLYPQITHSLSKFCNDISKLILAHFNSTFDHFDLASLLFVTFGKSLTSCNFDQKLTYFDNTWAHFWYVLFNFLKTNLKVMRYFQAWQLYFDTSYWLSNNTNQNSNGNVNCWKSYLWNPERSDASWTKLLNQKVHFRFYISAQKLLKWRNIFRVQF